MIRRRNRTNKKLLDKEIITLHSKLKKNDIIKEVNAAPNLLSEKVIDVIKFTKEEVLSGKSRDIDHIDYISLNLSSIPGYTFEKKDQKWLKNTEID